MNRAISASRYQRKVYFPESPEHHEYQNTFSCMPSPVGGFGRFVSKNKARNYRKSSLFDGRNQQRQRAQMARSLGLIKRKAKLCGESTFGNCDQWLVEKKVKPESQIYQLKELMFQRQKKLTETDTQNIHFTEYVMSDKRPGSSRILHSRNRRNSKPVTAPKQKVVQQEKIFSRKGTSPDNFKSIEIAKESKYVSVTKIGVGKVVPNKNINQLRNRIERTINSHKRGEVGKIKNGDSFKVEECQPWQTGRLDLLEDDHYLME